jgi:DNA modification methylase
MIYQGDCLDILPTIEANTIQCCVTSPPYYGLRDYGVDGQIGLESTPEAYVEKLVAVFREVKRVLRDDGTLWLSLGDSYAGGGNYRGVDSEATLSAKQRSNGGARGVSQLLGSAGKEIGLAPKNLIGIPWRVAFALQSDGWYLRQDIIWHKPNPMPESVTDRCTKSHEYIFLLTKSARYFYDAAAVSEEATSNQGAGVIGRGGQSSAKAVGCNGRQPQQDHSGWMGGDGETRNRRSVWTITTKPYKEAHFATFPEEIPRTCILAGSKKGDTILDPFSGAGTTGVVAEKLDRKYIGIELNPQYTKMAEDRIYNVQPLFVGLEL